MGPLIFRFAYLNKQKMPGELAPSGCQKGTNLRQSVLDRTTGLILVIYAVSSGKKCSTVLLFHNKENHL